MSDLFHIRPAQTADAVKCSKVFCASVRELCVADHHGEEHLIDGWNSNKTPADVRAWINADSPKLFLAESGNDVLAVGGITLPNEVSLNYVSPNSVGKGVGKALLARLEQELKCSGADIASLTSTKTALAFYQSQGWKIAGGIQSCMTVEGYPMQKVLSALS